MWKVVQELIPFVLIILLLTQFVIPLIFNGKTWWLFRSKDDETKEEIKSTSQLSEEISKTKIEVDKTSAKIEVIKEKVENNLKTAEDLKKEVDKLKKQ